MPSSITMEENGANTVLIRGTGSDKARITIMVSILAGGGKLLSCIILRTK
jgi:hypothetical protein